MSLVPDGPPASDNSGELLSEWQKSQSREALDALLEIEVRILREKIRARIGRIVDPSLSVSDVAQEAVVRLLDLEEIPEFKSPAALRSYLWTTAWRLLVARFRQVGSAPVQFDPTASSGLAGRIEDSGGIGAHELTDRAAALGVTLNLLPPIHREVLELVYFENCDVAELAKRLDATPSAAQMRRLRAERALAKKLVRWNEILDD